CVWRGLSPGEEDAFAVERDRRTHDVDEYAAVGQFASPRQFVNLAVWVEEAKSPFARGPRDCPRVREPFRFRRGGLETCWFGSRSKHDPNRRRGLDERAELRGFSDCVAAGSGEEVVTRAGAECKKPNRRKDVFPVREAHGSTDAGR